MHLSPRSVAAGVRPFPLAMQHFYSFVSQVCHCGPALFRWPCSISIHLSPRSVTGGVRPFPLAMQHFYSFPKQSPVTSGFLNSFLRCVRPFCHHIVCGVRPFPLAMQHFNSLSSHVICLLLFSQVRCLHCWHPPFSAFQHFYSFVSQVISVLPQTGYC